MVHTVQRKPERKEVHLSLGAGSLDAGFPHVVATLGSQKFVGSLPANPALSEACRRWRSGYRTLIEQPRLEFEVEEDEVLQVSQAEFAVWCDEVREALNDWLEAAAFQPIARSLRRELSPQEEIALIWETDDRTVRQLPLSQWGFLQEYPQASWAWSLPQYRHPPRHATTPAGRVRVLVVLGDDAGIELAGDRQLWEALPEAEIVVLSEPTRSQLDTQLWDDRGWDVLFFAGHSRTQEEVGVLNLNAREELALPLLENALRGAIARGLQLAIFNSCDGLGLARVLGDWQLSQAIVMAEPVPNGVAQRFLSFFLTTFARGASLGMAIREASEKLQGLEDDAPCASWLPVWCRNPAEPPPTWGSLRGRNPLRCSLRPSWHQGAIAALVATVTVLGLRSLGVLQGLEFAAFDRLLAWRPSEPASDRVLVVEATEADVNRYGFPIPDAVLLQAIAELEKLDPAAIALDIFRDTSPPDTWNRPRLLLACSLREANQANKPGIAPPPGVTGDRLGFTDVVPDDDGVLRRQLLFAQPLPGDPCETSFALSTRAALRVLAQHNIEPELLSNERIRLGAAVLQRLSAASGAYRNLDDRGFQVLLDYRNGEKAIQRVSLSDVLDFGSAQSKLSPELVRDRAIFVGVTAPVSTDYFDTPIRRKLPGVLVQAHKGDRLLAVALGDRPLLQPLPLGADAFWVGIWAFGGGAIGVCRVRWRVWVVVAVAGVGLVSFGFLLLGWWVPLVPSALALGLAAWGTRQSFRIPTGLLPGTLS